MGDGVLICRGSVRDAQGDHPYPIAVALVVLADLVVTAERAGQDQTDAALLEHVRDAIAAARLQTAVSGLREPECAGVVIGGLGRVAHVQLEVVDAVNRHHVVGGRGRTRSLLSGHMGVQ
jgi:hypothetical protein